MFNHVEYLVKPFQDSVNLPVDGCKKMDIPGWAENPFNGVNALLSEKGVSADQYLDLMLKMWKERIRWVQGNPASVFVTVDIADIYPREKPARLLDLRRFAEESLGERFRTFYDGYLAAEELVAVVANPLAIHAYGEISDRCAMGETELFIRNLHDRRGGLEVNLDFDWGLCPDRVEGKDL